MSNRFSLSAAAKINLHLDITGVRPDGFHSLVSIFHAVDFCDELHFLELPSGTGIELIGDFDCPPEKNLIVRAVRLFSDELGRPELSFRIAVDKLIPSGGGVGGGSADAAAVLRGLNQYYDFPFSQGDLSGLGGRLGSDVPFFLGDSTAALVTGRGETLQSLSPLEGLSVVLVNPGIHVSTPEAFSLFDAQGGKACLMDEKAVTDTYKTFTSEKNKRKERFYNSFSRSLYKKYPTFSEIHDCFDRFSPCHAGLSGSGSTVFGVFKDLDRAEQAYARLKQDFAMVWHRKLLARWKTPY